MVVICGPTCYRYTTEALYTINVIIILPLCYVLYYYTSVMSVSLPMYEQIARGFGRTYSLSTVNTVHPLYNGTFRIRQIWRCKERGVLKSSDFEKQLALHNTPYCVYLRCLIAYEFGVIMRAISSYISL